MSTDQKSILITGCSTGIGYSVAKGLKESGYTVFATARKREDVERLRSEGFHCQLLDLNDSLSMSNVVKKILEETGGTLYALFNNGAYGLPGAIEDISREALRDQFETNVFGWHELTNMVLPIMRKQGYGRIIQNSSVLGFAAMPFRGAYNASKYAIEGLADTLRLELLGTDIHIVLVEPGPILSNFRTNGAIAFEKYIDRNASIHREHYEKLLGKLNTKGAAIPFTLPPEAVLKKVVAALETDTPSARYYVTVPTYLFAYLKRLLPTRALDYLLSKI